MRQHTCWENALVCLEGDRNTLRAALDAYRDRTWIFCGCGTSYYLAQSAAAILTRLTSIRTRAVPASEILFFPDVVFPRGEKYLLVPVSRSGTTTETLLAARTARDERGIPTMAISCETGSPLSRESDLTVEFPFQRERSVVMTGSFTTMLVATIHLASVLNDDPVLSRRLREVIRAGEKNIRQLDAAIARIAANDDLEHFVFLGQGPLAGIAAEAALKMQEMALGVSHSFHALEYRHGPMSTITRRTLITLLATHAGGPREASLAEDLKKLGGRILVLSEAGQREVFAGCDYHLAVPDGFGDALNGLLYMPLLQQLACHRAMARSINPDTPRNLTAVVNLGA